MRKKALIFGVTGQDGAYLSRLLLRKGCDVFGASRCLVASAIGSLRPSEIMENNGGATKAKEKLGWQAKYTMRDVVKKMVQAGLNEEKI